MKIIITPANSTNTVVIEGTTAELENVVNLLLSSSTPLPSARKAISQPVKTETVKPVQQVSADSSLTNAQAFVSSLYVYKPNRNSVAGRGRYIAELLALGKTYTYNELIANSYSNLAGVKKVIKKMSDAGAEFIVNDDSVLLIRVPNKKYKPARRADYLDRPISKFDRSGQNAVILATLSGKKVK